MSAISPARTDVMVRALGCLIIHLSPWRFFDPIITVSCCSNPYILPARIPESTDCRCHLFHNVICIYIPKILRPSYHNVDECSFSGSRASWDAGMSGIIEMDIELSNAFSFRATLERWRIDLLQQEQHWRKAKMAMSQLDDKAVFVKPSSWKSEWRTSHLVKR